MKYVTFEWVLPHINLSSYLIPFNDNITREKTTIWHVVYEWVMSRTRESWHTWMSPATYELVVVLTSIYRHHYSREDDHMARHLRMSHVANDGGTAHINESCLTDMTHKSVVSHTTTGANSTKALSPDKVMPHTNTPSHVWMSHITHKRVISHMAYLNESCHISMRHATHGYVVTPTFIHR